MLRTFLIVLFLIFSAVPLAAQEREQESLLASSAQEARAKTLFTQLKCEVCQGQSIADSNAALAQDMRGIIRQKVAAGEKDDAILSFFASRYGEAILMRPPLAPRTWLLWLAPVLLIAAGLFMMGRLFRCKRGAQ